MQTERYDNLDGLRAWSAIGILLTHVLGNGGYDLGGFVFDQLIPSLGDLVFLFMAVSGFSLCCGYFEGLTTGKISLNTFYSRRFAKVWPFFAVLCLLDVALSPSKEAVLEAITDLTLSFGLFPPVSTSVIGVSWFLGLAFVFYFLFPFVCYLLSDKKRAWLAFAVSILFCYLSIHNFNLNHSAITHSAMFFLAGCMVYLYRAPLSRIATRFWWLILACIAGLLAVYYLVSDGLPVIMGVCISVLIYALRTPKHKTTLLCNPWAKKLSGISLEVYLSHMVIVRALEKLGLIKLTPFDGLSFALTAAMTLAGTVVFVLIVKKLLQLLSCFLKKGVHPHG